MLIVTAEIKTLNTMKMRGEVVGRRDPKENTKVLVVTPDGVGVLADTKIMHTPRMAEGVRNEMLS